ncbi:MAG: 4Fe-4S binding protein [Bacteroidota bacterium]|nr:4Fe-4S binding protein [Bacteroidota bacterium]
MERGRRVPRDSSIPRLPITILEGVCDYCGCCVGVCSADAIELRASSIEIDEERCTLCMKCVHACPLGALLYQGTLKIEGKP